MVGQIPPKLIFKGIKFDARGLMLFKKIYNKGANHVFGAIAEEMEKNGLVLQDTTQFLKDLLPSKGVLTKKKPTKAQQKDMQHGRKIAKQIADLDIGQTVVLKDGAILAVESFEGTNATISRGAKLGGEGIVVVKVCSPKHDMRYDVPVAGMQTIDLLVNVKAAVLAVDAGKTLLLDKNEMIKKANENGLVLVAE